MLNESSYNVIVGYKLKFTNFIVTMKKERWVHKPSSEVSIHLCAPSRSHLLQIFSSLSTLDSILTMCFFTFCVRTRAQEICTTYAETTKCGAFRVHNIKYRVCDACTTHSDGGVSLTN